VASIRDADFEGGGMKSALEYVSHAYKVPAKKGGKVTMYPGKKSEKRGVITGASNGYLKVKFEGEKQPCLLHPKWELKYHEEEEMTDANKESIVEQKNLA
jgi:hypothetical protein